MSRIKQQPIELSKIAAKIISWVHLAERPLDVNELLCSLAVKDGDTFLDPRGLPIRKTLLNCCFGLVVVDQETSTVRFVHYSLQEYLSRQDEILGVTVGERQLEIASTCLTFLTFSSEILLETTEQGNGAITFLHYAATQWGHHLRRSPRSSDAPKLAKEYIRIDLAKSPQPQSLRVLYRDMYPALYRSRQPSVVLPVHIVAFFGMPGMMSNTDEKDTWGWTPLSWAARSGHEAVIKVLLETSKVDVESKDKYGQTPLSWAAENGYVPVVKLLLETGKADVESKDENGQTPLSWAAQNEHKTVVQLLRLNIR